MPGVCDRDIGLMAAGSSRKRAGENGLDLHAGNSGLDGQLLAAIGHGERLGRGLLGGCGGQLVQQDHGSACGVLGGKPSLEAGKTSNGFVLEI